MRRITDNLWGVVFFSKQLWIITDGQYGSWDVAFEIFKSSVFFWGFLTMSDMIPAPVHLVTHQIEFTDAERLGPGASWPQERQPPIPSVAASCQPAVNQGRLYFHGAPWPLQHRWFLSNDSEYLWPKAMASWCLFDYIEILQFGKTVPETASWIWKNKNQIFASFLILKIYFYSLRIAASWNGPVMWPFLGQFSGGARQVQSYTPRGSRPLRPAERKKDARGMITVGAARCWRKSLNIWLLWLLEIAPASHLQTWIGRNGCIASSRIFQSTIEILYIYIYYKL